MEKKLSDIVSFISGYAWKASEFKTKGNMPIIRIQNIGENKSRTFVFWDKEYNNRFVVKKGDLLLSLSGSIKLELWDYKPALLNQRIVKLIPKTGVDKQWLFFQLKNYLYNIVNMGNDALVNNVSLTNLKKLTIDVPDLLTQKRIAKILSHTETLIAKRKESIQMLDEFVKATFLEMFGDPVRNEKGWKKVSLSDFGLIKNGLNFSKNEKGYTCYYIGVGDFQNFSKISNISSLNTISLLKKPADDYFLSDGDLLFVRSNGNKDLVGRCVVVYPGQENVVFSGFCIRYRPKKQGLNTIYLSHLFRIDKFKNTMLKSGRGANIQNINQNLLSRLKIPLPPVELQNKFILLVEKTETLKKQFEQSLQELQNLYGSLSQRAFKGELDLSKVEIEDIESE